MGKSRRYGVRAVRFTCGDRFPVLYDTDDGGLANLDAMRYGLSLRGRLFRARSIERHLRSVSLFFEWCHECGGTDWRGRLYSGVGFAEAEARDLVMFLRVRANSEVAVGVVQPPTLAHRIEDITAFAEFVTRSALHGADGEDFRRIQTSLNQFAQTLLSAIPAGKAGSRKSLPPRLQARLLEVINPESSINPWAAKLRLRNYCIVVLMLDHGLRLSEVCRLKLEDLILVGASPIANVRNDRNDPNDPRVDIPEAKTLARSLPLSRDAAFHLAEYEGSTTPAGRPKSLLARKSPFFFLSQGGQPIARRTIQSIVERIVECFPEFKGKLTAHVLRRCFNNAFRKKLRTAGYDRLMIVETQRYACCWSPISNMPDEYSREDIESNAHSIMMRLHQEAGH